MKVSWVTPKPSFSFIPRVRKAASQKALDLATTIWQGTVDRTPVGSGELRASWNLSRGSPDYSVVGEKDSSPGPGAVVVASPTAPNLKAGVLSSARYYVSNGKTYAIHVELGSSSIKPALMMTRAIQAA